MNKFKHIKKLRTIIFFSILIIVILQMGILVGVIMFTDTPNQLNKNSIQIMKNSVYDEGNVLEQKMVQWSDLSKYNDNVTTAIDEKAKKKGVEITELLNNDSARKQILEDLSDVVLSNLRQSGATESFIIFNNSNKDDKKDAIYFRDMNPDDSSLNNYDILVEAGPGSLMSKGGLTLDINWSVTLPVNSDSDFYNKPFNAGNKYKSIDVQNLGYWSHTFNMFSNDIAMITYTIPLLDENHNSYGVIGVGISIEHLKHIIDSKSIIVDNNGAYLLGSSTDSTNYKAHCVAGAEYDSEISNIDDVLITQNTKFSILKDVYIHEDSKKTQAILYEMKLYNTNTPFENEKWVLAGLVHTKKLFEQSKHLINAIIIALASSLGISIIGAFTLSLEMTKPLKMLMLGLKKQNKRQLKLPRTNMFEIDQLAHEIEIRNDEVYNYASKVANIIKICDIKMGVMEYIDNSDKVFCTDKVFTMFELSSEGYEDNYIEKEKFIKDFKNISTKFTEEKYDEQGVYRFNTNDGSRKWVKITVVKENNNQLCLFFDVTKDMLIKEKIKHERDYDVLTKLFNRRAFADEVKRILYSRKCESAIFSIWDLDNLKSVNDTYGHDIGDKYICLLAQTLGQNNRNIISARMAGDEFMVFIYNMDLETMYSKVKEMHKSFISNKLILPDNSELNVSVSAGVAVYKVHGDTYEELMKNADSAMYVVKKGNKCDIRVFEERDKNYF